MGLLRTACVLMVAGFLVQYIARTVILMGVHKHILRHAPGPCRLVDNIVNGSEDIQTMANGLALITSGLNVMGGAGLKGRRGAFYLFDFNDPEAGATEIKVLDGDVENPHGLGIWEDPKSDTVIVFVINHAFNGEERVEKLEFDKEAWTLRHIRSISDLNFHWPNDVVPTGPHSFYLTNSFGTNNEILQKLEMFTVSQSSLIYYDGTRGHRAAEGVHSLNGINLSPNGRFLYASSFQKGAVHIFQRKEDNTLEHKELFPVHTSPDNIDVDPETGDLWIGCHPIVYRLVPYGEDPSKPCPSQVLRLKMKDGSVTHMEEVYAEDGHMVYGSSVANYYRGSMLIGTVHHKVAYCQVLHLD